VYCPPAEGKVVPNSAIQNAPSKAITPDKVQMTKDMPTDPTWEIIPLGEMKIPEKNTFNTKISKSSQ